MDQQDLKKAAEWIVHSSHNTGFTGAGISVESGIPPFRGENGLWNKYDPGILDLDYFYSHPEEAWRVIKEIFYDFFGSAEPNAGHKAMAKMQQMGLMDTIITQNIDMLHHRAGSRNVVMIGDQLATDIAGANAAGIDSALITGGVATASIPAGGPQPTWLLPPLGDA